MAFELHRPGLQFSLPAASAIFPKQPVQLAGTSAAFFLPISTNSVRPFGVNGLGSAGASGLLQNDACVAYEEHNYVKAVAAASVGVGAELEVANASGGLGVAQMIAASGHWSVGQAVSEARAGETFTCYVRFRKA